MALRYTVVASVERIGQNAKRFGRTKAFVELLINAFCERNKDIRARHQNTMMSNVTCDAAGLKIVIELESMALTNPEPVPSAFVMT